MQRSREARVFDLIQPGETLTYSFQTGPREGATREGVVAWVEGAEADPPLQLMGDSQTYSTPPLTEDHQAKITMENGDELYLLEDNEVVMYDGDATFPSPADASVDPV